MSDTTDVVTARWIAGENAVVGYIQPQSYTRRIKVMAITGPANSSLNIYRGYNQVPAMKLSGVYPADIRTYDSTSSGVITINAGDAATFAWTGGNSGVGQTGSATVMSEVS